MSYVIIETFIIPLLQPKEIGLPFTAYFSVDEVREVGDLFQPSLADKQTTFRSPLDCLTSVCHCN